MVIDGEPLRYLGGCAGDTGHVIIQPGGPSCSMGCRGCAEALCGVAGIEQLAKSVLDILLRRTRSSPGPARASRRLPRSWSKSANGLA